MLAPLCPWIELDLEHKRFSGRFIVDKVDPDYAPAVKTA